MKTIFLNLALDCGVAVAETLALAKSISKEQVNGWLAALPAHRMTHHY